MPEDLTPAALKSAEIAKGKPDLRRLASSAARRASALSAISA